MNPTNPTQPGAVTPTPKYFWKQIYQIGEHSFHWALCDTESEKEGKVSSAYMVLLANYPNGIDGKPVGEQDMPKRIVDALNELTAAKYERDGLLLRVNFLDESLNNEKMVHRITTERLTAAQRENERLRGALQDIAADCVNGSVPDYALSALTPPANPTEEGNK